MTYLRVPRDRVLEGVACVSSAFNNCDKKNIDSLNETYLVQKLRTCMEMSTGTVLVSMHLTYQFIHFSYLSLAILKINIYK